MAGDWIKCEHSTPDKEEMVCMAGILGIDQDAVVGKCLRLWIWADQQSVDGCALSVTNAFIDRFVFQEGFAAALSKVGWLEGRDGRLSIPNFDRQNGQTAKKRAQSQKRMSKKRNLRDENVTQKSEPEKRREEKSNSERERGEEIPKSLNSQNFLDVWAKYRKWSHAISGKKWNVIQGEQILLDLAKRGPEKSIADLNLTMQMADRVGRIWDSDREKATAKPKGDRKSGIRDAIEKSKASR